MPDFSKRLANNNVPKTEYDRQRVSVANIVRSRNDGRGPKINTSVFEKEYQDFIASLKVQKKNEEVVNITEASVFEKEYQDFIASLKAQKKNEAVVNITETKVEEPHVTEEAPVVETKPKKTRTKKQVVKVLPEETVETTAETTEPVVEADPFAEF